MIKTGDLAKIINDPVAPVLNGLIGTIVHIRNSKINGQPLYKIEADNYGPYMVTDGKTKKVMAWKKGDVRSVHEKNLQIL